MEFGSIAAIAGVVVSLVFSALALWMSIKNSRDTRAYKDPVFVLECEPMVLDPMAPLVEEQARVTFKLVNQGEAFARDVRIHAEFDPFGLHVPASAWPYVERSGGSVLWSTAVPVTKEAAGVLSQVDAAKDQNMCLVVCRSQAGHKVRQRIPLPDIYSFVTWQESQIH